jgi:peptide-methionine (S)-S-oxide reductase
MLTWLGPEYLFRKHFPNKLDKIIVGYTGGNTGKPTYKQVCAGTTGHAESIQITYDPEVVSYESLVDFFFRMHGTYPSHYS